MSILTYSVRLFSQSAEEAFFTKCRRGLFSQEAVKCLFSLREPPSRHHGSSCFSNFNQTEINLFKHVEQLFYGNGDYAKHQMPQDFPMPFNSDVTCAIVVFQIRVDSLNR